MNFKITGQKTLRNIISTVSYIVVPVQVGLVHTSKMVFSPKSCSLLMFYKKSIKLQREPGYWWDAMLCCAVLFTLIRSYHTKKVWKLLSLKFLFKYLQKEVNGSISIRVPSDKCKIDRAEYLSSCRKIKNICRKTGHVEKFKYCRKSFHLV